MRELIARALSRYRHERPDGRNEIAVVPGVAGRYVLCPTEHVELGESAGTRASTAEWISVDQRVLVDPREVR